MKKCLIIETHSDDSCISCSGFINKYSNEYQFYSLLICCSEIKLLHANKIIDKTTRYDEYINYCRDLSVSYLGSTYLEFQPFDADTTTDTIPFKDIVSKIEKAISKVKPDLLITQGGSFHQDHENTYKASISALRPCCGFYPSKIWIMENPTYVHYDKRLNQLSPNIFVNLSEEQIDNKLKLFNKCFPSQVRESGNYLSGEGIKEFARYRGIEARCNFAEGFYQFSEVL